MNPKLAQLQLAFFLDYGDIIIEKDKLSVAFKEKFDDIKFQSQILDVPKQIPNVPFLLLQDGNACKINVSNDRCDFYYDSKTFKTIEEEKEILSKYITKIYDVLSSFKIKIYRIGNIATFVISESDPNKKIRETFINTNKKGTFDELIIRYKEVDKIDSLDLNVITTISSGKYKYNEKNNEAIIVQRDINSIKEHKYNFDKELFEKLVNHSNNLSTSEIVKSIFE